jgi:RHS repeat-associated protein
VSEYLTTTGAIAAHYEYDPFGNTVVNTDTGGQFTYKFSTKLADPETGLYYYGYRYYDPMTGRWPSRDPIGEKGGANLYCFVGNDGSILWDLLGAFYPGMPYGGAVARHYGTSMGDNIDDILGWSTLKLASAVFGSQLTVAAMDHADGTIPGDWTLNAAENKLAQTQTEKYAQETSTKRDFDQWLKDVLYNEFYGKPNGLYVWTSKRSDFFYPKPVDGYSAFGHARIKVSGDVNVCKGWVLTTISLPKGVVELDDDFSFSKYSYLGNTNLITPTAVGFRLEDSGYLHAFKTSGTWNIATSHSFL